MKEMLPIVGFLIVGLVFVVGVQVLSRKRWERAAAALGLQHNVRFFSRHGLHGTYGGYPVEVYTVSRGTEKNRQTSTIYELDLGQDAPEGFGLASEGVMARITKFFGAQDVEVGLDLFDGTFVVKGRNAEAVRRYLLRPGVDDALMAFYANFPSMQIKDGRLIVENHGTDRVGTMQVTLDAMAGLAHVLLHAGDMSQLGLMHEQKAESEKAPATVDAEGWW